MAVLTSIRAALAISLVVLTGVSFGQANDPVPTTICELVKSPERFRGTLVQVRAEYVSTFQRTALEDKTCSASIPVGAYHVVDDLKQVDGEYAFTTTADDLKHPERLKWMQIERPRLVRLVEDQNYRQLRKYANAKFRWKDGGMCLDCPLYKITATITGRFDYFETQMVAVRKDAATKPFTYAAGDSNGSLSRLVLQSISDVVALPIAGSVYAVPKRRNVTLEEADNLVYAYLKATGCDRRHCSLEPYHDPSSSGLYGFQALNNNPINPIGSANLGYFEVDPRTGDVWNGVICEQFTSPSLLKIQRTIRQRIGLTDEEYRNARRPGPMCEPGMPRISTAK